MSRVVAIVPCLALFLGAQQPTPPAPKKAAPKRETTPARKPVSISKERIDAAKNAAEETIKAFREGKDVTPSPLVEDMRIAIMVQDVNRVAVGAGPLGLARHIHKERVQEAIDVSERAILTFNETGRISFRHDERDLLANFRTAAAAGDSIDKMASPAQVKGVKPELIRTTRAAAQRLLAKYNETGKYDREDDVAVREFLQAVDKKVPAKE